MRWTNTITDRCGEFLRALLSATFMINGFLIAAFVFWFVARFLLRLYEFCERTLFSHSWTW